MLGRGVVTPSIKTPGVGCNASRHMVNTPTIRKVWLWFDKPGSVCDTLNYGCAVVIDVIVVVVGDGGVMRLRLVAAITNGSDVH